jgi:uncharacterized protein YbaP (TraB family)
VFKISQEELKGAAREADRLIEAWKAGNEKEVETISTQAFKGDPRLEPFAAKLMADRNKTMADIVEKTSIRKTVVFSSSGRLTWSAIKV